MHQAWQLFDDSTVRAPNASDWCSTRVCVMVDTRHENIAASKQHVNQNDGVCTEHDAVGGVLRRQSDTVNDNEEDTSDGTSLWARPEGVLLHVTTHGSCCM